MQTLSMPSDAPVASLAPRSPGPRGPTPTYWAQTAPHPFMETMRSTRPEFARRQSVPPPANAYLVNETDWVMADAVEQTVSHWLIVVGGSVVAAVMGALMGGAMSL